MTAKFAQLNPTVRIPCDAEVESDTAQYHEYEISTTSESRIASLDGLRAVAFLSVFIYHLGTIPGYNRGPVAVYNEIVGWGFFGVDLFFVISGFIITSLLLSEQKRNNAVNIKKFFQRRALRIWPLFYLTLCLSVIGNILFAHPNFDMKLFAHVLQSAYLPLCFFLYIFPLPVTELVAKLMQQTSFPTINSIAPLWSVCVEEQFYLIWPFVIASVKSKKQLVCAIVSAMLFCEYLRAVGTTGWSGAFYLNPLSRVAPLALGALVAIGNHNANKIFSVIANHSGKTLCVMLVALLVVFTYPGHALATLILPRFPDYFIAVTALGALLVAALKNDKISSALSWNPLRELGKYTYCMYLFHCLVIRVTRPFEWEFVRDPIVRHVLWCVLSFTVTLGIAKVSWKYIERPLARRRARLTV